MDFCKLKLTDIGVLRPFFNMQSKRICDCTSGSIVMWRTYFDTEFAVENGSLFLKFGHDVNMETAFNMPLGGDRKAALEKIRDYCQKNNIAPLFFSVLEDEFDDLRAVFGECEIIPDRDWSDYLYDAQDLVTYKGRRFNGQRNHLNKFKSLYPHYKFEEITTKNTDKIREFLAEYTKNNPKEDATAKAEIGMIYELLDNYELYALFGAFISVDEKVVAFSVGEKVGDTLFTHIEKANISYNGVYQAMVNDFAKRFVSEEINFINREEDVGDEGLRRSKLSYHPTKILEKHRVVCK